MIRKGIIDKGWPVLAMVAASTLAACGGSAPTRYYTLVPPVDNYVPTATQAAIGTAPAAFQFELLPVGVPAQVDQPQLVVRQGGQGVAVLDGQRWVAPLGDEVRSALSADLARQLHTQDVSGLPSGSKPVLRIKVDLRRFDSVPGGYALIDAAWSLRSLKGDASLSCTSRVQESVGEGYEALVQGHQRAIDQLATQIAAAASSWGAGQNGACPPG
ncbi:PqiC family protein [Dyella subtropica]|uniref:PqiC family protein n=1 Tax=Dyella subtropica TaxID=2992127 RepID=UPI0022564274|nr:PqiC family protein [Dyella subtropica]